VEGKEHDAETTQSLYNLPTPTYTNSSLQNSYSPTSLPHYLLQQLRSVQTFSNPITSKHTATMSNTVNVKGISHETTEKEVRDFFSFW
jgi:RNA recognition motif-containing protein